MDTHGIDYAGLKPGLYVQRGAHIKALDISRGGNETWLQALGFDRRVNADELTNKEAWTNVAITRRVEMLQSIPYAWVQGESDMEDGPFGMRMRPLLAQIDKALQTKTNGAYLYKLRGMGKQIQAMIWLDPDTVTPDMDTATLKDGIRRFERKKDNGKTEWIAAEDLVWFRRAGQRELQSDPSPLEASRKSAEVLYNLARLEDFFYEGAGMPIMLVMIPAGTNKNDKKEIEGRFKRLANAMRNPQEIRTMAVREGVTIEQLSFSPRDLDLESSEKRNRDKVLAVHLVPLSIAMSNAANYATAISDQIQFAGTMATRLESIAETFNADADFMAAGYTLDVRRNELPVNQEEESQRAQAFAHLVGAGVHPEAAMAMLGYDLPENYDGPILKEDDAEDEPEPEQMPEQLEEQLPQMKSVFWHDDEKRFKAWYKKRGADADIETFNSNELSYLDKLDIIAEVNADAGGIYDWHNYP